MDTHAFSFDGWGDCITRELWKQKMKKPYYKVSNQEASLRSPDDKSIRELYAGGLDGRISEQDLRDNFCAHGEIETIKMVPSRYCAFVKYTTREGAEKAAEELFNKLVIKSLKVKVMWGMPYPPKPESTDFPTLHYIPKLLRSQQGRVQCPSVCPQRM